MLLKKDKKNKLYVHPRYYLEGGRPSQTTIFTYFSILKNNIFSIKKKKKVFHRNYKYLYLHKYYLSYLLFYLIK